VVGAGRSSEVPGNAPPILAIEVVSETNPHKDYVVAPDKYAASGARELWIFDPLLAGPSSHGGPHRLQVWQRDDEGRFVRSYAGDGPARSEVLSAFVFTADGARKLRIADDAEATRVSSTAEEAERAARESERAAKEAERAAKESERAATEEALARVAALEAELEKRR